MCAEGEREREETWRSTRHFNVVAWSLGPTVSAEFHVGSMFLFCGSGHVFRRSKVEILPGDRLSCFGVSFSTYRC